MEISLEQLLTGRGTQIKGKEYFPTSAYVEPFLERMQKYTSDFRVQVKIPDQVALDEDKPIDVFNRVVVQAVLPEELTVDNHQSVVGMVYGLDVRKPVVKFYSGALDMVCTNLCVFHPEQLHCAGIEPEAAINYKPVLNIMDKVEETVSFIKKLVSMEVSCDHVKTSTMLGDWIKNCMSLSWDNGFGKVKVSTSTPIDTYKLLFENDDSRYLVKGPSTSMYNIYGAFTQIITDNLKKDFVNQCEKTLLVKRIIGI